MESPLRPSSPLRDRRRPTFPCPSAAPTVAAVIPARNEQDMIGASIRSLLDQTRPPDSIFVVVSNSTDDTFAEARGFTGRHVLDRPEGSVACEVTVIDIGIDRERRSGALNLAWSLARRHDFVLTVDGDSLLTPNCLRVLLDDITAEGTLGGVSAVPSLFADPSSPGPARLLARAQRIEATAQAIRATTRSGSVPVHVGQCVLFRTAALREVVGRGRRSGPWSGNGAEDARLGIELAGAGFATTVSQTACSSGAALPTPHAVWAQQAKRIAGIQRLSRELPIRARLAHGLEWRTGLSGHLMSRLLLAVLVAHALVTGTIAGQWWWAVPPLIAVLVNLRIVSRLPDRSAADFAYALLYLPHEFYRTVLSLFHVVTVVHERRGCVRDHDADQAAAERGQRVRVVGLRPTVLLLLAAAVAVALLAWVALPAPLHAGVLAVAWVLLVVLVAGQSLTELRMLASPRRLALPIGPRALTSVPR